VRPRYAKTVLVICAQTLAWLTVRRANITCDVTVITTHWRHLPPAVIRNTPISHTDRDLHNTDQLCSLTCILMCNKSQSVTGLHNTVRWTDLNFVRPAGAIPIRTSKIGRQHKGEVPVQVMKAQMGSRGTAPFILNLATRWEWVVKATRRPLNPRTGPVPNVQEAGWAPGPVWTGAENPTPPVFDTRTVQPLV
jgi:hypothetical protein